jgi:predicted aconitase with swiveling domain
VELVCDVLVSGSAEGIVLRFDAPISFWGGINPVTSKVVMAGHPQFGQDVKNKILVIPKLIGSSSSAAIILELIYAGVAPKGLILGEKDAILPVGVLVARQMNWQPIPLVAVADPPFQTGDRLYIHPDGRIELI